MQKEQVDVISFTFFFFFYIEIQCNRKLIKSCYSIIRGIVLNMQKLFFGRNLKVKESLGRQQVSRSILNTWRDTVDYLLKKISKYEHPTNQNSLSSHVNQLVNNNKKYLLGVLLVTQKCIYFV